MTARTRRLWASLPRWPRRLLAAAAAAAAGYAAVRTWLAFDLGPRDAAGALDELIILTWMTWLTLHSSSVQELIDSAVDDADKAIRGVADLNERWRDNFGGPPETTPTRLHRTPTQVVHLPTVPTNRALDEGHIRLLDAEQPPRPPDAADVALARFTFTAGHHRPADTEETENR